MNRSVFQPLLYGFIVIFTLVMIGVFSFIHVAGAAEANTFQKGDVFAAVGDGKVRHFRPDGTIVATYDTGVPGGENAGMAFDEAGHLYLAHFDANQVFKFDTSGALLGSFGEEFDTHPESIVIDDAGNVYVGHADGDGDVLMFDRTGKLLKRFDLETERRGTDWIDLAADQTTLFYTSEGHYVKRFDITSEKQLSDFNEDSLPGSTAYALRILPNGEVIVANTEVIVRLSKKGKLVKQYDAPGEDYWFAVNLDPDGKTFWSGNLGTGQVYQFDIQSGEVIRSWNANVISSLGGLAVFGEIRVAQSFTVTTPRIPRWLPWLVLFLPLPFIAVWLWRRRQKPAQRSSVRPVPPKSPKSSPEFKPPQPPERASSTGATITHDRKRK